MTLKANPPVEHKVYEGTSVATTKGDDKIINVYNCEAQAFVPIELKCPILKKAVKIEHGSCKERCEFAS